MTTQTPTTEERVSRLEGAYEQVNERLADLRTDVNSLRGEMNERLGEMNERLNDLARRQDNFRNTMLLLVGGVWATMIGGFIAIFTRL